MRLLGKSSAQLIMGEVEEVPPSMSAQFGAEQKPTMICQSILVDLCGLTCTCL